MLYRLARISKRFLSLFKKNATEQSCVAQGSEGIKEIQGSDLQNRTIEGLSEETKQRWRDMGYTRVGYFKLPDANGVRKAAIQELY